MQKQPPKPSGPPAFGTLLSRRPDALAVLEGSPDYPAVSGIVRLFQTGYGVVLSATVTGLSTPEGACHAPIFALHIHEGGDCAGDHDDPFAKAMGHYNPDECPHPYHAGDLPPLFGCDGNAFTAVLTNRFTVKEVLGRAVIIHGGVDDFTSQPAGNAGQRIACGIIRPVRR